MSIGPSELGGRIQVRNVEGSLVRGKILESRLEPREKDQPNLQLRTALEVGAHRSVFVWESPGRICTMEWLEKVHFVTDNPCCDVGPDFGPCAAPMTVVIPISVDGSWSPYTQDSSK
jgi:hypothetical protein